MTRWRGRKSSRNLLTKESGRSEQARKSCRPRTFSEGPQPPNPNPRVVSLSWIKKYQTQTNCRHWQTHQHTLPSCLSSLSEPSQICLWTQRLANGNETQKLQCRIRQQSEQTLREDIIKLADWTLLSQTSLAALFLAKVVSTSHLKSRTVLSNSQVWLLSILTVTFFQISHLWCRLSLFNCRR